ncbi:hypothetical protein [Sphingomonas sp.]|uniref:hypothetical protein n=1 Tax=Sphingomonas sp. TaxID=28214 RepID=UPI00286B6F0B|nr:hypothetical protein [Sphingomonas sp.]
MRALILLAPALLLGACQVTEDKNNGSTTVAFNQDVAENAGADVLDSAKEAANAIASDAKEAGSAASAEAQKAGAAIRNTDVDVTVNNKAASDNKQ